MGMVEEGAVYWVPEGEVLGITWAKGLPSGDLES